MLVLFGDFGLGKSFDLKDAWYLPVEAQFEPEFIIQFMKRLNHG